MTRILFRAALCAALLGPVAATAKVEASPHNMSAGGPGTVKDAGANQVCAFCHVGHTGGMGGGGRALWVPDGPPTIYKLYESSTLQSTLNQPTGSSRICLSCHDGTTAAGILRKKGGKKPGGMRVTGKNSLGTDLSDDHPISFVYDQALAAKQGQLADPASLPKTVRLDEARQVQCTTCHDPHDQGRRSFLRMDDRGGALCATCHRPTNWAGSSHATSTA